MTAHSNVRRSYVPAALFVLGLAAAPRASQAQTPGAAQPTMQHQHHKDPAALKPPVPVKATTTTTTTVTTTAAPDKPAAPPPPTGAEVGRAVDAMSATCGKALALSEQIEAAVARRKASETTRQKSNVELKKKLRAVLAAQKKVERASKKAGNDAAPMAEAARIEYEAALAQGKTVEVETQNAQAAQDELAKLVAAAQEASTSCSSYEASIRAAATEARKAVAAAKRDAAKARALAGVPAPKALEAARVKQAKELEVNKTSTEGARAALEAMKAEAAKQPAPTAPVAPPPAAASKKKPEAAGKPEKATPAAADKPK
jgi:hypothetical protein